MKRLKFFPSIDEFKKRSAAFNVIPVFAEIMADTDTPVSAFMKMDTGGDAFLLESVEGGEKWGRYSFLGVSAKATIRSKGKTIEITEGSKKTATEGNPLDALRAYFKKFRADETSSIPRFFGGAVGFMGYDMVRHMERLPDSTVDDLKVDDMYLMITDGFLVFDNVEQKIRVVVNAFVDDYADASAAYDSATKRVEELVVKLRGATLKAGAAGTGGSAEFSSNVKKADFLKSVEKVKEYIFAGDIIQTVISQRFSTPLGSSPFDVYRALRVTNPSPYMFFLRLGDVTLAGSSPEILVRVEDGVIDVRPIAGTRKRGKDEAEDTSLEKELLADPKERAEHIMLVDLGRNDVGRVSKTGSVKVDEFMVIERYSHVMHIVSNVKGRMRDGVDSFDVLSACFPAGTLTGAPKIRAMEIIEEVETTKRGVYGGCVGYMGFSGNVDLCIAIRTVLMKDNVAYVQAGAGIVADSVPEKEFEETENKARGVLKAVTMAKEGFV
ncbi:MAG: anthranilate synthase component I [Deltaproteobacteria bacterium]|nr:anthranilate synthase component I [Deltaproteobacteria bacterium]